jgi:hypothetical protein
VAILRPCKHIISKLIMKISFWVKMKFSIIILFYMFVWPKNDHIIGRIV